ncbi:UNVERIFIED_CONTAM: hypothetical protein HDU68_007471 [Siphonaria sp. JEL0065]|nr:hypothetical protein HDU68_007471 [Siphonaria sp. JEL0065]
MLLVYSFVSCPTHSHIKSLTHSKLIVFPFLIIRGHSLTVIGVEVLNSGDRNLLVLDPGTKPPPKLQSSLDLFLRTEEVVEKTLETFRFPEAKLASKKAYQLVQVVGVYDGVLDPECRKVFRTRKIE